MDTPKPVTPVKRPLLTEEWDDPAMIELMRQQSEDRVEFARTFDAKAWREAMSISTVPEAPIRLAPKGPRRFKAKHAELPW
jgi:hypothetical protein